ncbi:hypothetical protein [Paenibacillus terrigena]|uniref:hypothetical protein n=1 Tax=Paenibacillus terrigena TaxID=369333 RepID=UPI0028D67EA3|nr:hypothetical protein [Paenibacillus terrigena]
MKKWITVLLLIGVVASVSACSLPSTQETKAEVNLEAEPQDRQEKQGQKDEETTEKEQKDGQGMTKVFSDLMALKLPQGLEAQSSGSTNSKLIYTDEANQVKLEMLHDPEQLVTDEGIDMGRLKMRGIFEQQYEGVKLEWLKDETQQVHGKHIAINEVIVPSKAGDTYHLVAWAELAGAFLEITFTCPADVKEQWQASVHEMIDSIQM